MKSRTGLIAGLLRHGCDPARMVFLLALRQSLLGCETVLDVGCGDRNNLRVLGVARSVGFEAYEPAFNEARRKRLHDQMILGDARKLVDHFQPRQFDACIAIDVIEHLTKEDGLKMMKDMETIAAKKVILFAPNGFVPQAQAASDDLQAHLSGWEVPEMRQRGYEVIGQLGPKNLRGEHHAIKRPAIFWGIVSLFCQLAWISRRPGKAAAIFCVKYVGNVCRSVNCASHP